MTADDITKPNSYMLIQAAKKLGIGVQLIDKEKFKLELSYQGKTHFVTRYSFGINSTESINFTHDKYQTTQLLNQHGIHAPQEILIHSPEDLDPTKLPSFPLVIKPRDGQKGAGVYVGIKNLDSLRQLTQLLFQTHQSLIIQNQALGTDYRFTVLQERIIGISARHPQAIKGDGYRIIQDLITHHNHTIRYLNKTRDYHLQNGIRQNDALLWHIQNQGKSPDTVLENDAVFIPLPIANFQTGGWVETLDLSYFHQRILDQIIKITQLTGLTIAGIDVIISNPQNPPEKNLTFIEINSDPSLRLHDRPNKGENQHTYTQLLKHIFDIHS